VNTATQFESTAPGSALCAGVNDLNGAGAHPKAKAGLSCFSQGAYNKLSSCRVCLLSGLSACVDWCGLGSCTCTCMLKASALSL
jgi:hypothetical protein